MACQVVRERDFKLVARQTLDLSSAGMLVRPDCQVLTGEPLLITFQVPLGGHTWFDAEAVVARVIHGRRPSDRGPALGLAFTQVDLVSAFKLEKHLAWFREAGARAHG